MRNTMMKNAMTVLLTMAVFFAGCAGREANPIPVYLPGDNERSCGVLVAEIAQLQADMQRILPKTNKGVTNTLWATAGVFLIVPFFFMDLKDAEKIEFDAMRVRHNRLLLICADKGCAMTGVRAERIPSAKEAKKMAKEAKKMAKEAKKEGIKKCVNCGTAIGKLEKSYVFEDSIVCATCYSRLSEQKASYKVDTKDKTEDVGKDKIEDVGKDKTEDVGKDNGEPYNVYFWEHSDKGEVYVIMMDGNGTVLGSHGPIEGELQTIETYELNTEKNAELQAYRDEDKLIYLGREVNE